MKECAWRELKDDSAGSNHFRMETKMTDFNNAYSKKAIDSIVLTLTEDSGSGAYFGVVEYRLSNDATYSSLTTFNYDADMNVGNVKDKRFSIQVGLKDIYNFQLRITLDIYNGSDVGLNDIFVSYREYRSVTTEKFAKD